MLDPLGTVPLEGCGSKAGARSELRASGAPGGRLGGARAGSPMAAAIVLYVDGPPTAGAATGELGVVGGGGGANL
jgi:hypothetical protein